MGDVLIAICVGTLMFWLGNLQGRDQVSLDCISVGSSTIKNIVFQCEPVELIVEDTRVPFKGPS